MKAFSMMSYRSLHVIFTAALLGILLSAVVLFTGYSKGAQSTRGFSLPEGEPDLGKLVFMEYRCLSCHRLEGYEDHTFEGELATRVKLGGDVTRVKTYAELVTSVINPSHKISSAYDKRVVSNEDGSSKMRNYNDVMTVTELVNLVAFLQPHYDLVPYQPHNYPNYHP